MDNYTFSVTISRRGMTIFGVLLSTAIVISSLVGVKAPADAAGGKKICVTANGDVVKRNKCKSTEQSLAPGKVKSINLPTRKISKSGNVKMRQISESTSFSGRNLKSNVSGETLELSDVATSGVVAVTEKVKFPAGWTGTYFGSCPDYAPIEIGGGSYEPTKNRDFAQKWWFGTSQKVSVSADSYEWAASWPSLTVYITQLCAPIVDFVPAK
jgi:hypothetical protein